MLLGIPDRERLQEPHSAPVCVSGNPGVARSPAEEREMGERRRGGREGGGDEGGGEWKKPGKDAGGEGEGREGRERGQKGRGERDRAPSLHREVGKPQVAGVGSGGRWKGGGGAATESLTSEPGLCCPSVGRSVHQSIHHGLLGGSVGFRGGAGLPLSGPRSPLWYLLLVGFTLEDS